MVAQLLKRLRWAVDVTLGPRRRARADARIRALGAVREILVLCHGNICRSPYAAAVLEALLRDRDVQVDSAGFLPPGRPVPPHALAVARGRGVDLGSHLSRAANPLMLRAFDLIVVMEPVQRARLRHEFGIPDTRILLLGDLDPGPTDARGITDPWNRPIAVFEEVYARIERCVAILAALVAEEGGAIAGASARPAAFRASAAPGQRSA